MNSNYTAPTSATQAKERLYSQLAGSLGRMSRAISRMADLNEQLQVDLQAMQTLSGLDAAKFMTVASLLVPQEDEDNANEVTPSKDQELGGEAQVKQGMTQTTEDSKTKGKKKVN